MNYGPAQSPLGFALQRRHPTMADLTPPEAAETPARRPPPPCVARLSATWPLPQDCTALASIQQPLSLQDTAAASGPRRHTWEKASKIVTHGVVATFMLVLSECNAVGFAGERPPARRPLACSGGDPASVLLGWGLPGRF